MTTRPQMILFMAFIGPEQQELFARELQKITKFDFSLQSNIYIYQSAPNLVKMYVTTRSRMSDYGLNQTRITRVIWL